MLKVGQIEQVEITGYSSEGMGVCRVEGCAVFVPNAIRGEVCEIRITHVSRSSAHGKIERILERSPHRIARVCPNAKLCGGCQLHHMDYREELSFKSQKVYDALTRLGGVQAFPLGGRWPEGPDEGRIDDRPLQSLPPRGKVPPQGADEGRSDDRPLQSLPPRGKVPPQGADEGRSDDRPLPITGADEIGGYRNKAQYPFAVKNGRPVAGFYQNRTHAVIPVQRCAILPEVFDRVKDVVLRWAQEDRVSVYDEATGRGLLRHLYVRKGAVSGEIMVCLVVNGERLPRENRLIHALRREIPGLASLVLSENTRNTNVVLGDRLRTLWGRDWIEDQLCGFTFRLSPHSFYQINHRQAQRLYEKAVELADLHGTETVLDLYCGTGTITLALSRRAGKAVGVEVVPQAVEDARQNAARNGVTNVEFYCADVAQAVGGGALCAPCQPFDTGMRAVQGAGPYGANGEEAGENGLPAPLGMAGTGPDVIVVDPPRKGLAPEVIDAMAKMAPDRIVYVSCDPATLARDVKLLTHRGYTLTHAEAFDLFPRTFHVECVTLMTKSN